MGWEELNTQNPLCLRHCQSDNVSTANRSVRFSDEGVFDQQSETDFRNGCRYAIRVWYVAANWSFFRNGRAKNHFSNFPPVRVSKLLRECSAIHH